MIINAQHITKVAVVGLGLTGQSCVRFLLKLGVTPKLFDTRTTFDTESITSQFGPLAIDTGPLDAVNFDDFELLLVSPGVAVSHPAIKRARDKGCRIWGDIELFAHFVSAPVIAITGSNGKTTVTTLLGEMAVNAGVKAAIGGNIGIPVLDLVSDDTIELFILELSSFQLETTYELSLTAATILNVTDDHLDRYDGFNEYAQAKQRIYLNSQAAVVNRQDQLTYVQSDSDSQTDSKLISFGLDAPQNDSDFGLKEIALKEIALKETGVREIGLYRGDTLLMAASDVAMIGTHNQLNALAAIALGTQAGLSLQAMIKTLTTFSGLEHRCQQISTKGGVRWINDSKATNVGATIAALDGLADHDGKLVIIAGGDAKGADLSPLKLPFSQNVDQLLVIGVDQELFCDIYPLAIRCDDLQTAVRTAQSLCTDGDIVLLSPACASLDMFKNYIERGQCFVNAVEEL